MTVVSAQKAGKKKKKKLYSLMGEPRITVMVV